MKKIYFSLFIFILLLINSCSRGRGAKPVTNISSSPKHTNINNNHSTLPAISNIFGSNVRKKYFTGGKLRSAFIMADKNGQNGLLKKYGYDGKLTSTVPIHKGVKDGIETLFDSRGRTLKKTPYVNGRKEGTLEVYYPNGDIMAQITYVNNVRQGKAIKYDRDGSINQQVVFTDGYLAN